ncbi:MAG: hypothetical protein ACREKE_05660 [bacterium]
MGHPRGTETIDLGLGSTDVVVGGPVVVLRAKDGHLYYDGLIRCGSVSSCPVCSPKIRNQRALEIQAAIQGFRRSYPGGDVVLATLTVPHRGSTPLALSLQAVLDSWSRGIVVGNAWSLCKQRYGVIGSIRALEIQCAGRSGWHPHLHVLLFCSRPMDDAARASLQAELYRRWCARLARCHGGLGVPSVERGVRLDLVRQGDAAAEGYLTKLEAVEGYGGLGKGRDGWGASVELARADLKHGWDRGYRTSLAPFEVLDMYAWAEQVGDMVSRAYWYGVWREYAVAMFGRPVLHVSRGLYALLGVRPVSDEEALAEPDGVLVLDDEEIAMMDAAGGLGGVADGPSFVADGAVLEFSVLQWSAVAVACGGSGPARVLDLVEAGLLLLAVRFRDLATARFEEEGWLRWYRRLVATDEQDGLEMMGLYMAVCEARGAIWARLWLQAVA